ncbi:MAG: BON domain-containing protein [Polyangiales bacterium]
MARTDDEIKRLVEDELRWDTRVKETDVGVTVKQGVVTLVGTLSSWGERIAAEKAAHRVAGVLDVANDLHVKIPGSGARTDTEIAQAVRHALDWDVFVPKGLVTSTVHDGWVTLEGQLTYWSGRVAAEKAVSNLAGVVGVVNKLEVKPQVYTGDVRRAIAQALERRSQRQASHVSITAQDGRVTLSGNVATWADKQAVLGAARSAPGVHNVEDKLRVSPYAH